MQEEFSKKTQELINLIFAGREAQLDPIKMADLSLLSDPCLWNNEKQYLLGTVGAFQKKKEVTPDAEDLVDKIYAMKTLLPRAIKIGKVILIA